MGALHVGEPRVSFQQQQQQQVGKNGQQGHGHGAVVEEIHGLIKVYRDGFVERIPAIPDVPCTWGTTASVPGVVIARDAVVDRATGVGAAVRACGGGGCPWWCTSTAAGSASAPRRGAATTSSSPLAARAGAP